MMKKILYLFACLAFSWSCSNFLKEDSQNLTYVESISDLDEVLLGEGYMNTEMEETATDYAAVPAWIHLIDDDVRYQWAATSALAGGVYAWQRSPFEGAFLNSRSIADNAWKILYQKINALNIILYELEEFQDEADYNRIKGEALFLRAGYYWWLVNIYAKAYDVKTAANEPGVPLKLTEYVEDYEEEGGFSRASVAQVYEQIVKDLQTSVSALSGYGVKSIYRASEYAARLLLSRVYLHMENYEGVVSECGAILENSSYRLRDYKNVAASAPLVTANSPEVLFSQGGNALRQYCGCGRNGADWGTDLDEKQNFMGDGNMIRFFSTPIYMASEDLLDAFNDAEFFSDQSNDIRFTKGFEDGSFSESMIYPSLIYANGIPYKSGDWSASLVSDRFTLRLAEAYLNMAEALACLGRDGEASDLLLTLREYRLTTQTDRTALKGEKLIRAIRAERRLEFNFEGFRWLDLRRYAVNSVLPEKKSITHVWREAIMVDEYAEPTFSIGTYILKPYGEDAGWVFPIPSNEYRLNEDMVKNEERPIRNAEED